MKIDGLEMIQELWPSGELLMRELSQLSHRSTTQIEAEITEHLASRLLFVLLGVLDGAPNYNVIRRRLRQKLSLGEEQADRLADALSRTLAHTDASHDVRRTGLKDLPYPVRQEMFRRQNQRCFICGFNFSSDGAFEKQPTLDHIVPIRLGGDSEINLCIVCRRCNLLKSSAIHIGERGRTWINNHVYNHNRQSVAFWTLMRDRGCLERGCSNVAATSQLFVIRLGDQGTYVVDNCMTVCENHIDNRAIISY